MHSVCEYRPSGEEINKILFKRLAHKSCPNIKAVYIKVVRTETRPAVCVTASLLPSLGCRSTDPHISARQTLVALLALGNRDIPLASFDRIDRRSAVEFLGT
jgi:hypothetical protein